MSTDPINIQVDPEALRKQIDEALQAAFENFAGRLHWAADILDNGAYQRNVKQQIDEAFDAGVKYGREHPESTTA